MIEPDTSSQNRRSGNIVINNMPAHKIGLWTFRAAVLVFRYLPYRLLYTKARVWAWLLRSVIRYRRKVVDKNLAIAFPGQSAHGRAQIGRAFYDNLADNIVETLKSYSATATQIREQMVFTNPHFLTQYIEKGQSVLVVGGHFYTWELGVQAIGLYVSHPVTGIYKPLSNPLVEKELCTLRARFGISLVSMRQALRTIIRHRDRPAVYVLISDQSPPLVHKAHWVPFFGRFTGFLPGTDEIARRFGYPVVYYSIRKTKRGSYELTFSELCAQPESQPPGAITARFAKRLQRDIEAHPDGWLWSHDRWKRRMPKNAWIWQDGALVRQNDNSQSRNQTGSA